MPLHKTYAPANEWPEEYRPEGASRESGFFSSNPKRRGKRSTEDMVANLDGPIEQAAYIADRIEKTEHSIKALLHSIGVKPRLLVIQQKPYLRRYL
jgi:hypothetical protein